MVETPEPLTTEEVEVEVERKRDLSLNEDMLRRFDPKSTKITAMLRPDSQDIKEDCGMRFDKENVRVE